MSNHIPGDLSIPPILRRTSASNDEAVSEISVLAYEKIDRWRDKLDQASKLNKRTVYERAAADLFLEAQYERNLGAVQAIRDAIYVLGRDHTGLSDDDIQYRSADHPATRLASDVQRCVASPGRNVRAQSTHWQSSL